MKRSDKMSKEEVFDFFNKIISGDCDGCPIKPFCERINENENYSCLEAARKYLFDEVPKKTVSRWQTIKSDEDFIKLYRGQDMGCVGHSCSGCPYSAAVSGYDDCVMAYFLEKIEGEDDDE